MSKQLEVRNLRVNYGEVVGIRDVSLAVAEGELVGLLGANGAGKSTTLKAIIGTVQPQSGGVLLNGDDVTRAPAHQIARRGVALVPEGRRIFKRMTVRENLQVGGTAARRGEGRRRIRDVHGLFPRLREREHQLAGTLSGGEQQMLAIGRAFMSDPDFVLYDEPSLGLAPMMVELVFGAIKRLSVEFGIGGVLVEQNVDAALGLVGRAYVLSHGEVALTGQAAELRVSPRLREAYLGTLSGG